MDRERNNIYTFKAGVKRRGPGNPSFEIITAAEAQVCEPGMEGANVRYVKEDSPDGQGEVTRYIRYSEKPHFKWSADHKLYHVSMVFNESSEMIRSMQQVEKELYEFVSLALMDPRTVSQMRLDPHMLVELKKTEPAAKSRNRAVFVRFHVWPDCIVSVKEEGEQPVSARVSEYMEGNPLEARRRVEGLLWGVHDVVLRPNPTQLHKKRSKAKQYIMEVRWVLYKVFATNMAPVPVAQEDPSDLARVVANEVSSQLRDVSFETLQKLSLVSAAMLDEESSDEEHEANDVDPSDSAARSGKTTARSHLQIPLKKRLADELPRSSAPPPLSRLVKKARTDLE